MSPEEQRKALYQQEKARLEAEEREKRLVHDRTVGGPMVPRPSRDFIEKSTGPLRSQEDIARLAEQRVDAQLRQAEREKADQDRFSKSVEDHSKRLEQKQDRTKDYWAKAQAQEKGSQRETTREYWNGLSKSAPDRAQTQDRNRNRDNDHERER